MCAYFDCLEAILVQEEKVPDHALGVWKYSSLSLKGHNNVTPLARTQILVSNYCEYM